MSVTEIAIQNKNFTELNPLLCGYEQCKKGHSFGPYVRPYYLIHYVISGSGTLKNAGGVHNVSAGDFFLIRPGEMTVYTASASTPWEYIWIGFNGTLACKLDSFDDVYKVENSAVFFDMLRADDMHSMREEYLTAQLFLLYRELFKKQDTGGRHTRRISNYISCNYMRPLTVGSIAADMHLDRRYLSRIFRRDYGMSIKDYITKEKMSHAEKFLRNGYSVRQTAEMVGYNDVFNFSKMFKKTYGASPSSIKP